MISPFSWTKVPRVPAVFVGVTAPTGLLGVATTEQLMMLRDSVHEHGVEPDGRLFVRFTGFDGGRAEVHFEVGVPTSEPVKAPWASAEPIGGRPGDMPGGFAASTRHTGTYASIPAALRALEAWIRAQGRVPIGTPFEFHTDAPEDSFDRNAWETELVWFVRCP